MISSIPLDTLMPVIVIIFVILALLEWILSATWNRFYFTVGLPIYSRDVLTYRYRADLPSTDDLESLFPSSFWSRQLKFHAFSPDEYGFRNEYSFTRKNSFETMHGLLVYDTAENRIIVRGYLNWSTLLLIPYLIVLLTIARVGILPLIVLLFLIGIFAVGYMVQRARFDKVVEAAAGGLNG